MYTIYEIPGVKIGCTNNFVRRQKEQRDKGKMIVLEEYTDIYLASERELLLQRVKGYPVDSKPYWFSIKRQKMANNPEVRKKASKTISKNWKSKSSYLEGRIKTGIKLSKQIAQYSLNGNLIKIWDSYKQLYNNKIYCHYSIQLNKPYKGYIWKYV